MKTLKKLILTIICIFALPIIVNADVAAPMSSNYIVTIAAKEGTTLYDWEMKEIGIIPFNEKLIITFESEREGELYGDTFYNGRYGIVKLSDTIANPEDIDFEELVESRMDEKYYTLKETTMYKGPSPTYGKIKDTTIPKNVTLEYDYYAILNDQKGWIYTEYNNVKGWVYVYANKSHPYYEDIENTTAIKGEDYSKILILTDEEVIHKEASIDSKETHTLEKNKEYKFLYYIEIDYTYTAYYIDEDKISGWYIAEDQYLDDSEFSVYKIRNIYIKNKDGVQVKDNYTDEDYSLTIPQYSTLKATYEVKYGTTRYLKVEYNNKKYWLEYNYSEDYLQSYYQYNIETTEEIKTYSELNNIDSESKITIPANTKLQSIHYANYYDNGLTLWFYVKYQNEYYWILDDGTLTYEETNFSEKTPKKETPKEEEKDSLTPKQIGLICAGGAIIIAVVAVVTIKLINKKKKEVTE